MGLDIFMGVEEGRLGEVDWGYEGRLGLRGVVIRVVFKDVVCEYF